MDASLHHLLSKRCEVVENLILWRIEDIVVHLWDLSTIFGETSFGQHPELKSSLCSHASSIMSLSLGGNNPSNKIPAFSDLPVIFCIDCKFFVYKTSEQDGSSATES